MHHIGLQSINLLDERYKLRVLSMLGNSVTAKNSSLAFAFNQKYSTTSCLVYGYISAYCTYRSPTSWLVNKILGCFFLKAFRPRDQFTLDSIGCWPHRSVIGWSIVITIIISSSSSTKPRQPSVYAIQVDLSWAQVSDWVYFDCWSGGCRWLAVDIEVFAS